MKKTIVAIISILALAMFLIPLDQINNFSNNDFLSVLSKSNSDLKRFTLDNGMACLVKEDHSAPVISIQFWVGTGAIHEGRYLGSGLSHAIEHMIFKGTATRKPGDIMREISDAGGNVNAYTGYDRTVFLADLPSRNWKIGLDVLSDAIMNPAFPEEEWIKEKEVILREIAMGYDDPDRVVSKLIFSTAFRTHPYKYPVIGYEAAFKLITRSDLAAFYNENYVSDNIIAVIVGDIKADEVQSALASVFANFKRKPRAPVVLPTEPEQLSPRFERKTGTYEISRLEWTYHTVPLSHQDAAALDVLAIITGQGRSSRLSRKIKEELKLAHDINAWSYTPKEPGIFGISAEFDPAKENELIAAVQDEIDSWLKSPFSMQEISKAKRRLLTSELSALQTMNGQADNYASGEFYASDPRYSETYLNQVNKLTPRQLLIITRKYLAPKGRSLAILSPASSSQSKPAEQSAAETVQQISKHVLSNNSRLLVREDHKLPFVNFCVTGKGGLLSENKTNSGITKLMSDLLIRGTASKSSEKIALISESLGGQITAFSGKNSFGIQAKCLSSDAETFAELISDCLIHSTFPDSELAKRKEILSAAIDAQYEKPFYVAQTMIKQKLFPNHPYQLDELGTKESLALISRSDIQTHARKLIAADNIVISIFGNIDTTQAVRLAEKYLSRINPGSFTLPATAKANLDLPVRIEKREPREQAIVLLGMPGIDLLDKRNDALTLLEDAMSGLTSQLSTEIRENRGLAYYSGAYNFSGIEPGMYVLYAGTTEDAVPEIEVLMKQEIKRITTEGLSSGEVERARNRLLSEYEKSLQDQQGLAMICALNELYGQGYDYIFSTKERYNAVSIENVKEAASSILSTNKYATSIVLPQKKGITLCQKNRIKKM